MKLKQRNDKMRDLLRMKWAATGLLIAMVALFVGARLYEGAHPVLGFVRAFAEAGMAGGIADWFAVTALFRHPLRLPLPHTAIVPRNKDRIGENLGAFFEQNFLSREVVADKLEQVDLSGGLLRWIGKPEHTRQIVQYCAALIPDLLAKVDARDVERFTQNELAMRIREFDLAPLVNDIVTHTIESVDYDALLTPALEEIALLFEENRDIIRDRVRERSGWIWQRISLDEKIADAVIKVIDEAVAEVRNTREHPWRRRFGEFARERMAGLAASSAWRAKCEALRDELLAHPAFSALMVGLWSETVERLREDRQASDSWVNAKLEAIIAQWAQDALCDDALRAKMNARAREVILELMPAQRHQLAQLIAETVRRWDTDTVTRKLEVEVGRDLQFVRINGTLIGGIVGLVLHALAMLA
ncbi:MAG TPA: DUF445 domain-containing protein [Trinickia sp.]|jgi:uncharacterized membrane-anchored protein YjiN (DUF445 family)|uniref:DUF445 domain-containing protein n=1 Tax=Trinickia sp. TaxID=2571163 RepID=UPI002D169B87|nr:DUF445 domain-containing protein [Trinickia sp.]HTI18871.1 DUF445 domain-containing protein [Trinickia sp.]